MTDQKQLLENWEDDFLSKYEGDHEDFFINLIKGYLQAQEAKTREEERLRVSKIIENQLPGIILDNIDYYVMLRDLDRQYHQTFNEMSYKIMEEAQQQILDLNEKKDEYSN